MGLATTVFTGFLGSGKTTVITNLVLALINQGVRVVYIKNELGEADLDAKLMRGQNIVSQELLNGCICCTLVGPFIAAIDEIITTYSPDRLIIESSGTADPASMALTVTNHPRLMRDGIISIIDVLNFEGYQDLSPVAKRQAEMTDLIVLNKVELSDLEQKKRVVGYIRELNEHSPIVEAPLGKLNLDLAFGLTHSELQKESQKDLSESVRDQKSEGGQEAEGGQIEGNHHDHHHLEDDQIEAINLKVEKNIDKDKFLKALELLPKSVFRVKGIVYFEDGPEVVNTIFNRNTLSPLPNGVDSEQTELICIGFRIKSLEDEIRRILFG